MTRSARIYSLTAHHRPSRDQAEQFVFRDTSGRVVHRFGRVSGPQWWEMLRNVVEDGALVQQVGWFNAIGTIALNVANKDLHQATAILLGIGAGLPILSFEEVERWILEKLDANVAGELQGLEDKLSGLRKDMVAPLLKGERLGLEGLSQYRLDFMNALSQSSRRTVPVHGPDPRNPWQPAPFGLWTKRDVGFVDDHMARQLEHLYHADAVTYSASDGYKVVWADDALTIPPEMISSPKVSADEYDYGLEFYNARKDEANSMDGGRGLFGQSSWTAGGMVAAGWLRVNRVMGTRFVDHTQ